MDLNSEIELDFNWIELNNKWKYLNKSKTTTTIDIFRNSSLVQIEPCLKMEFLCLYDFFFFFFLTIVAHYGYIPLAR
jgi:hypothetical protein